MNFYQRHGHPYDSHEVVVPNRYRHIQQIDTNRIAVTRRAPNVFTQCLLNLGPLQVILDVLQLTFWFLGFTDNRAARADDGDAEAGFLREIMAETVDLRRVRVPGPELGFEDFAHHDRVPSQVRLDLPHQVRGQRQPKGEID